jgi:hypothetical protein
VVNDLGGDGARDDEEPGLDGWSPGTGREDAYFAMPPTNADGVLRSLAWREGSAILADNLVPPAVPPGMGSGPTREGAGRAAFSGVAMAALAATALAVAGRRLARRV